MKINTGVDRNYIHTTSNYTIIIGKLEPDSISHFNASRNNLEKKSRDESNSCVRVRKPVLLFPSTF